MVAQTYQLHPNQTGRVLLQNISWNTYSLLLNEIGDAPIRLTYDRGLLEIEVPSQEHEKLKEFIGDLVKMALMNLDLDFMPLGSTTWTRRDIDRGLEADDCFYILNYAKVRNKPVDLAVDPPPDLAIEIDLTSSSIDKLGIYARLQVPEVWRVRSNLQIEFLSLDSDAKYAGTSESKVLPQLSAEIVNQYLGVLVAEGYAAAIRKFRVEIAQRLTPQK
jgi:Uma2 family endonuclease